MARHELVEALANADELPIVAIGGCLLFIDEVAPDLLAVVENAAAGTLDRPADDRLLFIALHILGGGRMSRLHAPLMQLLRRPIDELQELIGDSAMTATLGKIVAGGFNGNADDLFDLLCEPGLDPFVRSSVFGAVAFLTWAGKIDASATRAFLRRFNQLRDLPDDIAPWFAWSEVIELLGWDDMAPLVEQAYRDGRIGEEWGSIEEFHDAVAKSKLAADDDDTRFQDQCQGYIKDVAETLGNFLIWGASFDEDEDEDEADIYQGLAMEYEPAPPPQSLRPDRNPYRHVGRNDPCPCGSGKKYKRCCLPA